jgi:hypothetical protein
VGDLQAPLLDADAGGDELQVVDDEEGESGAVGFEPPGAGFEVAEDEARSVVEVERGRGDAPRGGVEVAPLVGGDVAFADQAGGEAGGGGDELQAQLAGAHFEGEDADGAPEVEGDVAGDVEGEGGLAHAGPAGDDVEAAGEEAGAEAVPGRIAGGEAAEILGAPVFDRFEQAVEDVSGSFPAFVSGAAEELVGGATEVGEEPQDRAGGGEGCADDLPGAGDQVSADAPLPDDAGVFVEAAQIGQVEVESGQVRDAADRVEGAGLLEMSLEGEEVGGGAGVGEIEEGLVEAAVALAVPVAGFQAGADFGEARGLEEEGSEDGALGFFAVRELLLRWAGHQTASRMRSRTSSVVSWR